jgi:peroxiredoxin
LLGRQIEVLRTFLTAEATGDDRWNGRLMLADLLLARGDRRGAGAALRGIDAAAAPALLLVTAATMAQHLDLRDLRDGWVAAAQQKVAPLPDRLAMARLLMTVLREIEAGEKVFAAALQAAGDDEQRAFVRWHRADALRDREDLPDNAGFEELDKLAKDLPATYWGSVARDRLRATQLEVGADAIPFRARLLNGGEVELATLAGKTVVLAFWSLADHDTPTLITTLQELRKAHGDKLAVISISLDRDPAAIQQAVKDFGIDFPVVGDGKGPQTDVALRWFVEGPVLHVIDGKGKVQGLGLHTGTADGRTEFRELVERCVKS